MKQISSVLRLIFCFCLFGQQIKYGITGDFHKGSIVNVLDISEGKDFTV